MDEIFKPGQLITARNSGFHIVISCTGDQVQYKQTYTTNGKPFSGQIYQCHVNFCNAVTVASLDALISDQFAIIDAFQEIKKVL